MTNGRVLAIGLDGMELGYAQRLIDEGRLPALAGQFARGAHVVLDHASATRTGLTWEHFWSGRSPEVANRPSAIEFDPATYTTWAEGARFEPFFEASGLQAVVLDAPYADLSRTRSTRGIVDWACHDPGLSGLTGNPPGLVGELVEQVGAYPATEWMYRSPWPSVESSRAMGDALVAGVEARSRAARWLFGERITDWDVGIVVTCETHCAGEAFWHGVDPEHPLHDHPSAPIAARALRDVYDAIDRFVGELVEAVDADAVVLFTMNCGGANYTDVPSMVLLPELVSRWAAGRRLLEVPPEWTATPGVVPPADGPHAGGDRSWYPTLGPRDTAPRTGMRRAADLLPAPVHRSLSRARAARRERSRVVGYQSVDWQPASWYQPWWSAMRAFALPSFYDGRIRVNVRGREAAGIVEPDDYTAVCDELEAVLRTCVNPRDGGPAVAAVERPGDGDPFAVGTSGADLVVLWTPGVFALDHPQLGLVGPVPYRRTGGHTGPFGFVSVTAPDIAPGDHGIASSFDVAPTVLDLAGRPPETLSGTSILDRLRSVPAS